MTSQRKEVKAGKRERIWKLLKNIRASQAQTLDRTIKTQAQVPVVRQDVSERG